jgi:hypothetical protein
MAARFQKLDFASPEMFNCFAKTAKKRFRNLRDLMPERPSRTTLRPSSKAMISGRLD